MSNGKHRKDINCAYLHFNTISSLLEDIAHLQAHSLSLSVNTKANGPSGLCGRGAKEPSQTKKEKQCVASKWSQADQRHDKQTVPKKYGQTEEKKKKVVTSGVNRVWALGALPDWERPTVSIRSVQTGESWLEEPARREKSNGWDSKIGQGREKKMTQHRLPLTKC